MKGKRVRTGGDIYSNSCLEYLSLCINSTGILNLKAKILKDCNRAAIRGLQSPRLITMQTKNYKEIELHLPHLHYF